MSVYNGEKYLKECMESVLNQLTDEDEFVVRDDGSTDGSLKILASYVSYKVRILKGENLGLASSLNKLLVELKGQYLARMDADDISLPGRFEGQLKELEDRGLDLISSKKARIDVQGNDIAEAEDLSDLPLEKFNPFTHGSWLMRRVIVERGVRYDESFDAAQDYDFLLRLKSAEFKMAVSDDVSYKVRFHDDQITQKKSVLQKIFFLRAQEEFWNRSLGMQRAFANRAIVHFRQRKYLSFIFDCVRTGITEGLVGISYVFRELRFYRGQG